jgi:thiol-disulfide isomerase/thioredoxin
MNSIYKIAVIVLLGIAGCKGKDKDQSVTSIRSGSEIDKIKLTYLDYKPIDLKQYRDKTIFINFWATWCKPCLEEMPSIQAAMNKLKNENIVFLFASDEVPDQIENFKVTHNYNFNYVKVENPEELIIMTLPTTYIFSPKGKLVFSEIGYRKWDDKNNIDLILEINKIK